MKEPIALVFGDIEKLCKGLTEHLLKLMDMSEGNFSLALSGGSTPKAWFDYLAKSDHHEIDWNRIHVFWGDERMVPPDDAESNYGMTKKQLLDKVPIPIEQVHRIKGELSPEEACKDFVEEMEAYFGTVEYPSFDLMILGMGDDGHTASIFPTQIELWDSKEWCVIANHPISGQKRISLTGKVINASKEVTFLVTGDQKSEMVKRIIDADDQAHYFPASLVSPVEGQLIWFLDQAAAKDLDS